MWFTPPPGPPGPSARSVERYLGPSPWAGEEPVGAREPQAFLALAGVDGGEIGVHFHSVDQFQYFVGGRCRFAGHQAGPGVVHYADHLRPYGPLSPEGHGVTFLTLRGTSDHGASYMPGAAPDLKAKRLNQSTPGRNLSFDLASVELGTPSSWTRLVDEGDGLCIALTEAAPAGEVPAWPAGQGDAYAVVVSGRLHADEAQLGAASFRYLRPGEALRDLTAVERTRIAVLCLPRGAA